MRIHPAVAFVCVVLVAGCATGEAPRQHPEKPRPDRALVSWAETVCTQAKTLDGLRSHADSPYYAMQVESEVSGVLAEFSALEDSGVRQADDYVAALVRDLERLRDELSADGDGNSPDSPEESRVTELVEGLGLQEPRVAALAERSKELAPSVHLAPGCAPLERPPAMSTLATRDLVLWADTMCRTHTSVTTMPGPGDELFEHPRFAPFEQSDLASYLSSVPGRVEVLVEPVAGLRDTGVPVADAYRSRLLSALREARESLPHAASPLDYYDLSVEELRARTREVADTVAAIAPRDPDLPGVARRDPALSAAYDLAPHCEPPEAPASASTTTLPAAENGTDVDACEDGTCQIEVSAPVDVTVNGTRFTVAVSDRTVWISSGSGLIRLTGSGTGRFGGEGSTVVFSVAASTDTTAVLDVSTE
ncbi:hypothetical protein [Saccharomonospora cyanea]|uniref:Uncharacterized protein n=1 Tax=Saccharomonospora cyanea NA-134 TaxID=882082 RepID=H5XNM5_9PSEU|nr:hypothetical protein [Saccharomonospora cyanea]EHR61086.1 hypothetical protein SaccyDRAFT_2201 [Saccharomonospora cyanea NA-134]